MLKKVSLTLSLIFSLFVFSGCDVFMEALEEGAVSENPMSEDYEPHFKVGVFSIVDYPRATEIEQEIEMPSGRKIWININQGFSSKNLKDCKIIARPGNPDVCDLKFKLDKRGRTLWEILAGRHRGEAVILAVDGRGVGKFIPEFPERRGNWVTLRVGVDAYTARGIVRYVKKNYDYYNPNAKAWFDWMFNE